MTKGRTDEPLMTDADVRNARARRMANVLRKLFVEERIAPAVSEEDDDLAVWLAKCLQAHECDILSLLMDIPRAKRAVKANKSTF